MEDRYLYRGKRVDNGEWVEGNLFKESGMMRGDYICPKATYADFMPDLEDGESANDYKYDGCTLGHFHRVIPETVGQCAGLKDKSGKLAFQGDNARGRWDRDGDVWTIIWSSNMGCNNLISEDKKKSKHISSIKTMKIIGNIHDKEQQ